MSRLDYLDSLVAERHVKIESLGASYSRSSGDRDNHSAHLTFETPISSVEMLLWESGDCELNFSRAEGPVFEHHVLKKRVDIRLTFERAIALADGTQ